MALGIASHAARVWRLEFSLVPGSFLPLLQADGSGAVFNVMSLGTPGVCVVGPCPSATARIVVNSALASTTSVAVADLGASA